MTHVQPPLGQARQSDQQRSQLWQILCIACKNCSPIHRPAQQDRPLTELLRKSFCFEGLLPHDSKRIIMVPAFKNTSMSDCNYTNNFSPYSCQIYWLQVDIIKYINLHKQVIKKRRSIYPAKCKCTVNNLLKSYMYTYALSIVVD